MALSAAALILLSLLSLFLLGYHPFAEDGGIYAAAAEARLNPALFPHDRIWVTAHTRLALFVPAVALVTRWLHLPLPIVLLALQLVGLLALLAAAAHLATTCAPGNARPWLAMLFVAVGAGLPVAGTALYVVDPYCTARTLTTPLLLVALSFALRKRWSACMLCWAVAAVLHPLMAIWAALPILLSIALIAKHPRRWILILVASLFFAGHLLSTAVPLETMATRAVAHTRAYWFPARWRWFEWVGAAAPCVCLAFMERSRPGLGNRFHRLAGVVTATTCIAVILAVCFAREGAVSLTLARLQPLRSLHLVFVAFLVAGGAFLQTRLRTPASQFVTLAACVIAGTAVFAMQRSLYPHTSHLEWPGATPDNPWAAAFLWCRQSTPSDALFALDSNYIDEPWEDSQGFRAIALRSALPDQVKDAGIAAVLPALTPSWQAGAGATRDLNQLTDAERRERLAPLGVTWLVLPTSARTALACPFQNSVAKICCLRAEGDAKR